MAKLQEYNGRFCESEYEYAFLSFLEDEGWQYLPGNSIPRENKTAVLYVDDMEQFLSKTNTDLTADEIHQIMDKVRLVGAESEFSTLHTVYSWMIDGVQFTPQNGRTRMVALIDFEHPKSNIFRAVNQFAVEYTNNGMKETRRPDILLFVNGIPLCIIELKNPADANATIYDAYEQVTIRYWRDIPHLLHYCPLACISDGVKTRLGTVRTPYEHFYAWRRVNDGDKISTLPFEEMQTMIKGVYAPERFLEIFRDYIYFQDHEYNSDEKEIVCRYPQFFATRLLKQSIVKSVEEKNGKGGTYFGATGCGKTYTMAFLARQLSLRCPELGSPTIIMIVDRDELQKQGANLFTKSKEFLNLGEVCVVPTRKKLREELGTRESGGFYICTIQKFCDREDDKIGLINSRANIICFSDEAHRTQIEHAKSLKFTKDADKNMRAMISKPYAKVLKEALPNATFVGFTGTPISETYQTFGEEIDRYTMDQAVADGLTVSIKYHPRITKVLLDQEKAQQIEAYYKKCFDDGATAEDMEASKKAMSSMEVILGEPPRLERLAVDIHDHYVASCEKDPDRVQKAMIVCSSRPIAYELLKKFQMKYPEWFIEKKVPDGIAVPEEEMRRLKPMPFMAMVASVGKNDNTEMYNYLGGLRYDLSPFLNPEGDPALRYKLLAKAAEFVFISTQELNTQNNNGKSVQKVSFKTYFLKAVKRMRAAYDICQPSGELGEEESALAQCFMAIAGFIRKMSGTSEVDADTMNRYVAKMVEEALKYNEVESVLETGEQDDIFSPEYFEKLSDVKMPASKLEMLVKMLRKQIKEYSKTNQLAAKKFQEMLEETIKQYHERRSHLAAEEAGEAQEHATEDIIQSATEQALRILKDMNADRESFRKIGLTFEEKAFYDILMTLRDEYRFEYGTNKNIDGIIINDKCKVLAKKIKEILDTKSSFADWLNNQIVRDRLKFDIKVCLIKNGYPPQYSPEVFRKVMEQVENFEENN